MEIKTIYIGNKFITYPILHDGLYMVTHGNTVSDVSDLLDVDGSVKSDLLKYEFYKTFDEAWDFIDGFKRREFERYCMDNKYLMN